MASSSNSRLSSSTLSLRFMQRATQEAVLPQQAKLVDDSEWTVEQEVLDMWSSQRFVGDTKEEAIHESSYLPFVFEKPVESQAGPSSSAIITTGRRVFGDIKLSSMQKDDERANQDVEEGEDNVKDEEDEEALVQNSTHLSVQNRPGPFRSNLPSKRPGPLLSKGARLVQMARESQAKEKERPINEVKNETDESDLHPKRKPHLIPNPSRDPAIEYLHHRDVTRGLMRPVVHLPMKKKEEQRSGSNSKGNTEGNSLAAITDSVKHEEEVGKEETNGATGKKKKRKRDRKVDLINGNRNQKKLKEIE